MAAQLHCFYRSFFSHFTLFQHIKLLIMMERRLQSLIISSLCFAATTAKAPAFLPRIVVPYGGDQTPQTDHSTTTTGSTATAMAPLSRESVQLQEPSLDEKVYAAMKKLGLDPPSVVQEASTEEGECKDGVCPMPESSSSDTPEPSSSAQMDPYQMSEEISAQMNVDPSLAMAALGATAQAGDNGKRIYDMDRARTMIQDELDAIGKVSDETPEVQQLVSEGFDPFMVKRSLAFAEMNIDDARAILVAEKEDEEDELRQSSKNENHEEAFKTVTVNSNIDPTQMQDTSQTKVNSPPTPAKKEDVVFEATTSQIYELVLESPVPVLLDVYASWCGPCKVLGPALEEMAVKSGGLFRLVKVNSDNERVVSGALEVTALPTVFGVRDGRIVNMFQGMPRSQDAMQNFMSGLLIPGEEKNFSPPVTESQKEKFAQLTASLIKVAGAASFPFSARERLQDRIALRLDQLAEETPDFVEAETAAKTVRSLLINVMRDPYDEKYRKVNLDNKVIASKVTKYDSAVQLLKSCGFALDPTGKTMVLGKNKKLVNVAPLSIARDSIDKWIDRSRNEVAAAARKRRDEEAKAKIQDQLKQQEVENEQEDEGGEYVDPNLCTLKLRLDGKKKVKEVTMDADKPLKKILKKLKVEVEENEDVQIMCAAKRLVVKSSDKESMNKSLRDHGLHPAASIVVKVGGKDKSNSAGLAERAASRKKKKTGSHTMQSIGLYSTQDNAKAELIDGGGGVWYEHDVTESEDEGTPEVRGDENGDEHSEEDDAQEEKKD